MEVLKVRKIEDSFWGNKRVQRVDITKFKRIYAWVNGKWHTTSPDGEPECPINNIVEVVE